ncbi:hypothetical protein BD779DRAFT_689980 [Infundibulicybe gibba]|nr:hypothetical protein BD779DRAFT_689980 [Infundibulicybe gibba]
MGIFFHMRRSMATDQSLPFMEGGGPVDAIALVKAPHARALWERTLEGGSGRSQLLELYLETSGGTALSLGFRLPPNMDDASFLPLVTPHLSRVQHLKVAYHRKFFGEQVSIHKHFPLLKSLELVCVCNMDRYLISHTLPVGGRLMITPLEGIEFPWAQLTQLTIQVSGSIEPSNPSKFAAPSKRATSS